MLYAAIFLLAHEAPRSREHAAAFQEVYDFVRERLRRGVRTSRGARIFVAEDRQEDTAHDVLTAIVANPGRLVTVVLRHEAFVNAGLDRPEAVRQLGEDSVAGREASSLLARYIETMLANRFLTTAPPKPRDVEEVPQMGPGDADEPNLVLLQRALEAHLAGEGREVELAQHRQSFGEMLSLTKGEATMKDLVTATIASDPALSGLDPARAATRARNRIFKRHQRLREYLAETIDDLERRGRARGGFSGDEAEAARTAARQLLLRRQTGPGGSS